MKAPALFLVFALFLTQVQGQKLGKNILLSVSNYPVSADEFEKLYNKNSNIGTAEKESVKDYFDLYVKFRLKVAAAIDAGIDTLTSFKTELKGYRDQLAKNYLTDNETIDKFVKEAYYRTANEVSASHIMVKLPENASPADTAVAYSKIMKIRQRILNGESFEKLAAELSDDPSAKINKGNLGYFSAFRMVYPFECGAYNTPVGQISMPVRTRFGYHLIKVNDKRPSRGEVRVAHIMVAVPQGSPDSVWNRSKIKIDSIYNLLKAGQNFAKLASKLSDDQNSGRNGGVLPWFTSGQMIPEFEDASFSIKDTGDFTKPIKTYYGWHIIKLLDKKPVASFEELQPELKTKIMRDERAKIVNDAFIQKLKNQYKIQPVQENLQSFYALDSGVYKGIINTGSSYKPEKPILTINSKPYSELDFKEFLQKSSKPTVSTTVKSYIDKSFDAFTDQSLLSYEDANLENKYPDFRDLVKEYREGILLFDIMDREVWTKSSTDSTGLEKYFEENSSKYQTPEPKKLDEIRGLVMADYQNYLEDLWLNNLKKKYKVLVNQKLLDKIEEKYKNK